MIPLNHIFRKCIVGKKHHKSKDINPLMYMDEIKLFSKIKKRIRNLNTGSEDIQGRYRDGIWHRKMCHANNEKWKATNDGRKRTIKTKSERSE